MYVVYLIALSILCLAALPIFLVIFCVVWVGSGRPVFFRQIRIGKHGKPFVMFKFRTMIFGAASMQKKLRSQNEAHGPVFKIYNDPRYTPIGKFLAHTGLDELPQLYNVLRGDMALFGPRPLPADEEKKLAVWQKKRECIKPGIISPWVVEGYHQTPFTEWMKSDITYTKKKNFWFDLTLFFRMIGFTLRLVASSL